jgi:hypothetical protein
MGYTMLVQHDKDPNGHIRSPCDKAVGTHKFSEVTIVQIQRTLRGANVIMRVASMIIMLYAGHLML